MISCILPSRGRPELLRQCIKSFNEKSSAGVEFWIAFDIDDGTSHLLDEFILSTNYDVKYIKVARSDYFHRDYHNRLIRLCSGKYIVGLNDECEVVEKDWDLVLSRSIEEFLADKPDRVCYIYINDSTHQGGNAHVGCGSCFPIITREAYLASGCYIPSEIPMWGGDIMLYNIYKSLHVNRILDLQSRLTFLHHSFHNGTRALDSNTDRIRRIPSCVQFSFSDYINRLDNYIKSFSGFTFADLPYNVRTDVPFMAGASHEVMTIGSYSGSIPFKLANNSAIAFYSTNCNSDYYKSIKIAGYGSKVHFLGLVAGWGWQGLATDKIEPCLGIRINFTSGNFRIFNLLNGEHISDFYNTAVVIPGSQIIGRTLEGYPLRHLCLDCFPEEISSLEITKLDSTTCPIIFATTFQS